MRRQQAVDVYERVGTVRAAARELDLPEETVRGRLQRAGVKLAGRKLTNDELELTRLLYLKHGSIREAARRLDVTEGAVLQRLRTLGVKPPAQPRAAGGGGQEGLF